MLRSDFWSALMSGTQKSGALELVGFLTKKMTGNGMNENPEN